MKSEKIIQIFEKYKYFLIVIIVGICFMVFPTKSSNTDTVYKENPTIFNVSDDEIRLEEILSQISGVGRVSVMLTTSETIENIYAKNTKSSIDNNRESFEEETIFTSKQGGVKEPVSVKNILPTYNGAVIVCDGADNTRVNLEVLSAIQSLYSIKSNKITISKMKE